MNRNISPLHDLIALIRISIILTKVRPHIVHGRTPKGGMLAILASTVVRVPIRIYHIYGLRFTTMKGWRRNIVYLTEKFTCFCATNIYSCVSKKICLEFKLCPEKKITDSLNGSVNGVNSVEKFNPKILYRERGPIRKNNNIPKNAIVIGFVGRIVKDKGFVELVDAWHILRNKLSNIHLLVVGPFESEDSIPSEVKRILESDSRIHLVGLVLDPTSYYSAMDIYVLPSYREGFPTTILEAAAMKLPVVATRIPGCMEAMVDGETGTLVNVRNVVHLADALLGYCENEDLRIKHGNNGRNRVLCDFQPEAIWKFMLNEYNTLLKKKKIIELNVVE